MKSFFVISIFSLFSLWGFSQNSTTTSTPNPNKKTFIVDASCGECNFEMDGNSCDLAVRIDGKPYFVDGANIMDYGHPHAKGGFCVAIRKAEVQGEVVNGRFKASYFKLLDTSNKDNNEKKN